jgi:hypothetical protein
MVDDAGPEAKRWALAATAVLTTLTRRQPRHDLLGGAEPSPEAQATAKTILANSWQIDGRDKLVSTLEYLGGAGQSADYAKAAAAYQQAPPQQRQQDPALAFVNQFGAEIGNRALAAWDLGRMLAVAGWGYLAGYCSEAEAWGASFSAGVRLRGTYQSWDEYAKHYRLGGLFFDASQIGPIDQALAHLTSAPDSPWRAVPWRLDGAPAPAGGFGPPLGAAPGLAPPGGPPPGAGGPPGPLPPLGGAPPGNLGGPPAYGGAPVVAPPPGAPGAPQAYGGVPVIAPPPPGAPGAPQAYGGVPVIAPTGGAGPYGSATPPAAAGGSKKMIVMIVGALGALFFVALVIGLVLHFRHSGSPPPEPAHHGAKHGGH